MSEAKIVKQQEATSFVYDQYMKIVNYFTKEDYEFMSIVKGYLNGPHGNRVNRRSAKLYFVTEGTLDMIVDGVHYKLEPQDSLMVPPGNWHAMEGHSAQVLMICSPAYNGSDEEEE